MIKKTITIFLSILMLLTICGCSSNSTDATSSKTGSGGITYSGAINLAKQAIQNDEVGLVSLSLETGGLVRNVRLASGDAEHIENEDENYWDVTIKGTFVVYDEYGRYSDSEAFTAEVEVDGITGDVLGIIDYSID